MDEILRYTDLAHAIQLARAHDLSDREIVRAPTGSMSFDEARKIAQRAAPLLEITVKESKSPDREDLLHFCFSSAWSSPRSNPTSINATCKLEPCATSIMTCGNNSSPARPALSRRGE
jgi:hypothetical protein